MAGYPPNPNQPQQPGGYPPQGGQQQPQHPQQPSGNPQQPSGYPQQQPGYPQQQQPGAYPPQGAPMPYGQQMQQQMPTGGAYPGQLPTECFGGFWIRFVGYIIDWIVLFVPAFIMGAIFGAMMVASSSTTSGPPSGPTAGASIGANLMINVGGFLMAWLYYSIMTSKYGGTLGKMAVGLRVIDEHGMYPSFGRATGRFFAKIISACTLLIGYILAGFNPQKRALHDSIAGTYVVRKEYARQQQPGQ